MKLSYITEKLRPIFATREYVDIKFQEIRDELTPIQKIVYGFIGLLLVSVATVFIRGILK